MPVDIVPSLNDIAPTQVVDAVPEQVPPVTPPELTPLERKQAAMRESIKNARRHLKVQPKKGVPPPNFEALKQANKERVRGNFGLKPGKVYSKKRDIVEKFVFDSRKESLNEKKQTRFIQMLEAVVSVASNPKHPQCVAAFNAVCDRAMGKPRPSEEEADAIAKGGIVVQIAYPAMADVPVREMKELRAPEPDFIEAEIVEET